MIQGSPRKTGGGVVKLVAGTNVTLTPSSGVGVVTIDASGGGGGVTSVTATAPLTSSGGATPDISTSISTNKLVGRYSAGTGVMQEISLGAGLSFSITGVLSATGVPAGANTEIQYNNSGAFGASSRFTFTSAQAKMTVDSINLYSGILSGAGTRNTFLGQSVGNIPSLNANNVDNTFVGATIATTLQNGYKNHAFGVGLLRSLTDGIQNVAIGDSILGGITTNSQNIGIGVAVLDVLAGISGYNIGIGNSVMQSMINGNYNTSVGSLTLGSANNADGNSAFGHGAFNNLTSGDYNVGLGIDAGAGLTTGSYNTFLGVGAGSALGAADYSIALGAYATTTGSNQMVVGSEESYVRSYYFGSGRETATPLSYIDFHPSDSQGTNVAGTHFDHYSGVATGNATGGSHRWYTPNAGASGTTPQSSSLKMELKTSGELYVDNTIDSFGNISVDIENRYLYNAGGVVAVSWNSYTCNDGSGNVSIEWDGKYLYDSSSASSVNWDSRNLYDASSVSSFDWGNRAFIDSAGAAALSYDSSGIFITGKTRQYNSWSTVASGAPSLVAEVNLTAQTAAITATTIYAVPSSGEAVYRVSFIAKVTTAASLTSTLGGANGFQIKYTDADDSVVVTSGAVTNVSGLALNLNTTQAIYSGSVIVNVKKSTNLQYLFDYASAGGTAMQYSLHIRVEPI